MVRKTPVVATLLLAFAAQTAAADEAQALRRTYSAAVDVDAAGDVTRVQLDKAVPRGLADAMKQAAALAEFEPALLDGVPAPSRTTLNVTFQMVGQGNSLRAEVVELSSGGGGLRSQPPRYPPDAVRAEVGAKVWASVSFGADGKLDPSKSRIESMDLARPGRPLSDSDRGRFDKQFRRAVETMMAKWVFVPDEVAGRAIPASVWVPVTFCPTAMKSCDTVWASDPAPRPTVPAALDDAVRLAVMKPYAAPDEKG